MGSAGGDAARRGHGKELAMGMRATAMAMALRPQSASGASAAAVNHDHTHGYRVSDSARFPVFPTARGVASSGLGLGVGVGVVVEVVQPRRSISMRSGNDLGGRRGRR